MQQFRDPDGHTIIASLLERRGYDREFAHALLDHAQDRSVAWAARRIAALAFESQLLSLDLAATDEFTPFLARLGLTPAVGAPCRNDVLKQGYTTTEPVVVFGELRRRLSRLAPVHQLLRRSEAAPDAVAHFRYVASQECLLTVARAVFGPDEVISEILRYVRVTAADISTAGDSSELREETKAARDLLPDYEAEILSRLLSKARAWWLSPATPATHNALVACPIGTLALIIRPPGSTAEFEIKRVGMRGTHALTVAFEQGGTRLAPSHRLQGGGILSILQWEAKNSALLSRLFRRVHGEPAPISQVVQLRSVKTVPRSDGREIQLLNWFEQPEAFGEGFDTMRHAITQSLFAFVEEGYVISNVPRLPKARTRTFLQCLTPAQCTLVGTSALRLDNAAAYLSSAGADSYLGAIHGRAPTLPELCRFADVILMEILDTYRPPVPSGSYATYVAAAFADAENRAAADRAFMAAVASLGRLWGTLLGLRGYTEGEAFVPRNVGLRTVWSAGAWHVRIIFMDHELTSVAGKRVRHFHPKKALSGMHKDWVHIVGGELGGLWRTGTFAVLAGIYRADAGLAARGRARMIEEIQRAYRVTLARMREDRDVRSHFRRSFVQSLPAWDAVVGLYRASRVGARERARWKGQMRRVMTDHGLDEPLIQEYRHAIHRYRRMLRRAPFLFDPNDGA